MDSPWRQPWGTDVNLRLSPGRGDTIIQIPAGSPDQVDFVHEFLQLDVRGTDGHNHSVVRLTKKAATSDAAPTRLARWPNIRT